MSTEATRTYCTNCSYEYFEHYRPITLKCQLETGVVTYRRSLAWCNDCQEIRYVESLPSLDEIRCDYASRYFVPGPVLIGFRRLLQRFDRCYQERVSELDQALAWRQERTVPPRCLE